MGASVKLKEVHLSLTQQAQDIVPKGLKNTCFETTLFQLFVEVSLYDTSQCCIGTD